MRTKVTDAGVVIPRQWLEGVDEVEIRQERNVIVIIPVPKDDPILTLGTQPILTDMDDASIRHDRYLTGQ